MKDKGNSMTLQKVSNKEKIETIISKYKNQGLKYTTDLLNPLLNVQLLFLLHHNLK